MTESKRAKDHQMRVTPAPEPGPQPACWVSMLLCFVSEWSPARRPVEEAADALREELGDRLEAVLIDAEDAPASVAAYAVVTLPCFILINGGIERARLLGARSRRRLIRDLRPHLRPAPEPGEPVAGARPVLGVGV